MTDPVPNTTEIRASGFSGRIDVGDVSLHAALAEQGHEVMT